MICTLAQENLTPCDGMLYSLHANQNHLSLQTEIKLPGMLLWQ